MPKKRKMLKSWTPNVVATTATRDNLIRSNQAKVNAISRKLYNKFK